MALSEAELRSLIRPDGESETIEYKQSPQRPEDFAKSLVCLSNTRGGRILVGVDNGGRIVGFSGKQFEEWVAQIARDKVSPPIVPLVDRHRLPEGEVSVVEISPGPDKPYARVHENHRSYFIRVGTTCREPSAEELRRLFQASGRLQADESPVRGTSRRDLDGQALASYLRSVYRKSLDSLRPRERVVLLTNLGYLHDIHGQATLAGLLLFCDTPEAHLPESRIFVARFSGADVGSGLEDRLEIGGRLPVLLDNSIKAVQAALRSRTRRKGGRLVRSTEIPGKALREALVNAVVHRDYTLRARTVRVLIFNRHVEVRSPGSPPNTMTVSRMVAGSASVPRNPLIFTAMAHMGYVQNLGMGVRSIVEETRRLGRPAEVFVDVEETVVRFTRRV